MLAVDTNIIVRYLTNDDQRQSRRAKTLIDSEEIFVCTTVLLETEWVLRSVYDFAPAAIAKALEDFAGLSTVTLEDPALVAKALDWAARRNMDFADALLLAKAQTCDGLVSFDRKFAKIARAIDGIKVRVL